MMLLKTGLHSPEGREYIAQLYDPNRLVGWGEHYERFVSASEALIHQCRTKARLDNPKRSPSLSYRQFIVMSAVYAFKQDAYYPEDRWKIFYGANVKVGPSYPAICAEPVALTQARCEGYTRIIGMVVVGNPQIDEETGETPLTLMPCCNCRRAFQLMPEVKGSTVVISAHLEEDDIREAIYVADLLKGLKV